RHGSCGISPSGERGNSAFNRFVQQSRLDDELANTFVAEFRAAAAIESTYRANYFLASKFTIDTSAVRLFAPNIPIKIDVLGICGQFIPLTDIP
ncbi:hypothetical protein, partial [Roseicyclus sp.]|uniref:hypothetical protein n=1 Tax=Roseicyclus sp. TaxID=1914329 RepID=UPI003F6973FF